MTDDAQQYFNAWAGVFETTRTTKLLCAWHVTQAWRTALNDHVSAMPSRREVYHQLRMESKFRHLLQNFLSHLDNTERRFSGYFKEHNCNRLQQWASYFRTGSIVNTNMFPESFHRTLKVVYPEQKRIVYTLLNIKIFEQVNIHTE